MRAYDDSDLLIFFRQQLTPLKDDRNPVNVPAGSLTAVTVDSLVEGVHFPVTTPPEWIAHKALAVNLSDLAAMGARPVEICLSLIIPAWDENWLQRFATGLVDLLSIWPLDLAACHVCAGPLSITIQAQGHVDAEQAMRRSRAKPGDQIFVTGTLGDAACALPYYLRQQALPSLYHDFLQQRLNYPEPRVSTGLQLAGYAHAAIDISDGLSADLGHILKESQVGATLHVDKLPLSPALHALSSEQQRIQCQLGGGDDFELCFTLPLSHVEWLNDLFSASEVACTWVGEIVKGTGIEYTMNDHRIELNVSAYDHFSRDTQEI